MGNEDNGELRRVTEMIVNRIEIDSDTLLEDIDSHFKVVAGPGAGKTYWLIKHVKNVLSESDRLTPASKIACISFTNTASREMQERLGDNAGRVWVSTIHRFLYSNIVKPYVWLLEDEEGEALVNWEEMRGHSDHYITYGTVMKWLQGWKNKNKEYFILLDIPKASKCLNAITWKRDRGKLSVTVPSGVVQANKFIVKSEENGEPYLFPTRYKQELMRFKRMCWKRGDISHNDVLYLAIQILDEYPRLIPFLTAAFPYVFVDEFQDTSPMQTELLKKLGHGGAVIGLIGDPEQSIYEFNGASPEDFVSFTLPGMTEYMISGNRRSTVQIIEFLNEMRKKGQDSLTQYSIENKQGPCVTVLVGSSGADAARILRERLKEDELEVNEKQLTVLTRTNEEVILIRNMNRGDAVGLWEKFEGIDSERTYFYKYIIEFVELSITGCLDEAASCLSSLFPEAGDELRSPLKCAPKFRGYVFDELALTLLENLLPLWREPCDRSLFDINNNLMKPLLEKKYSIKLTSFTDGERKEFAKSTMFRDLIQSLQVRQEMEPVRTIHKAKGAQFNSVLVCLRDEDDFVKHFVERTGKKEEIRVRYVAASRAMERLYIHVPQLSAANIEKVKKLGLEVLNIE